MRLLVPFLLLAVLLSACGGGQAVQPTSTPAPAAPVISAPADEPTESLVQPTEAPVFYE